MIKTQLQHIGIIMDGNRRWAKSKFLPAIAGHKAGADNVVEITTLCSNAGISYLTLWALSTENLKNRPLDEIQGIIKLINSIESYLEKMKLENLKFQVIGDIEKLPEESRIVLDRVIKSTENNSGITLTLALIYGGQDEIVRATKKIIKAGINPDSLDEDEFKKYLDTANLPPIELIVRTGGDIRHSGFLLYDSAYSEYYFTEKRWPEFNKNELEQALNSYNKANRNFGK